MSTHDLLSKNWVYIYTRRMTYQKVRLYYNGLFEGILGIKFHYELYRCKNGDMFVYHERQEEADFSKKLYSQILDKDFVLKNFKGLEKKLNNHFNGYIKHLRKIPQNPSGLTNLELDEILQNHFEKEGALSSEFWTLFGTVEVILVKVAKKLLLDSGIDAEESERVISDLAEPRKMIPLDMARLGLLKIALLPEEKREEALRAHAQEFGYMPMYDTNYEAYDLVHFQNSFKNITDGMGREEIEKEIQTTMDKYAFREERCKKILKRFKKNKHLYCLLDFFAAYSYLKDLKPLVRDKGSFYVKNIAQEIAQRLGLDLTETLFLTEEEISRSLKDGLEISREEIQKRVNNSLYFGENGKISIETNEEILEQTDLLLNQEKKVKEIKGAGVSRGLATGKVYVILSNNDFKKFEDGGILVTSATRPDFVPLMKKASAIVTNEGGILSHAAIISRELKKPCIVGTGKATNILKDGDVVEVDANKGIVKILS